MLTDSRLRGNWCHQNQMEAWRETELKISDDKSVNRIILDAQPQSGKTGYILHAALCRLERANAHHRNHKCIIVLADSNNALKDQIEFELRYMLRCQNIEHLSPQFLVVHRSNLKKVLGKLPAEGWLTIFNDESHIAAHNGGIRYEFNQEAIDFKGDNVLIIDVSATLFAHRLLHEAASETPYDGWVRLIPDDDYNSMEFMHKNGRLHVSENIIQGQEPTDFLKNRMKDLINEPNK